MHPGRSSFDTKVALKGERLEACLEQALSASKGEKSLGTLHQ
jgi:hypothetical protein